MSLTRNFFNEFRPFFRLFDEVSRAHPSHSLLSRRHFDGHFDDFGFPRSHRPSVDLAEQGNEYVVQAEVPGVKKEDLEVRVGDQGRSVTIEGKIYARSPSGTSSSAASDKSDVPAAQDSSKEGEYPDINFNLSSRLTCFSSGSCASSVGCFHTDLI
jgi:HSP20 family molecular chaperone IbpA